MTTRIKIPRGAVQVTVPFLKPFEVQPLDADTVIWKNGASYPPIEDRIETETWGPGRYVRDGEVFIVEME